MFVHAGQLEYAFGRRVAGHDDEVVVFGAGVAVTGFCDSAFGFSAVVVELLLADVVSVVITFGGKDRDSVRSLLLVSVLTLMMPGLLLRDWAVCLRSGPSNWIDSISSDENVISRLRVPSPISTLNRPPVNRTILPLIRLPSFNRIVSANIESETIDKRAVAPITRRNKLLDCIFFSFGRLRKLETLSKCDI